MKSVFLLTLLAIATSIQITNGQTAPPATGVSRVPVMFSGGHETECLDRGRPVKLIAAALGVPPEVFREAFTHVHPAGPGSGGPTDAEARANKAALMNALSKYGVTNVRLDEVSNYYRYRRDQGELWTNKPAAANALVKNGKIMGFEIISGGSGYSSAPAVSVQGIQDEPAVAKLSFGKDLRTNGSVLEISILSGTAK